ncbi:hypothetical protein H5410_042215 [Solanum commersonii]|uniref:Uncharacterized protein n=1 Tax=Solanum commersonii TaxID=4109 RepID=A0A9J5XV35_SOLCO|nr:hypothetical protein H5410_042215 [Solanum commersonii]
MPFKTLAMEPVGLDRQIKPFSRSNEPRASKPLFLPIFECYSPWIFGDQEFRLPMGKLAHFQGQTSPEKVNPPFCQFFGCNSTWIFGDLEFRCDFIEIFHGHPLRP